MATGTRIISFLHQFARLVLFCVQANCSLSSAAVLARTPLHVPAAGWTYPCVFIVCCWFNKSLKPSASIGLLLVSCHSSSANFLSLSYSLCCSYFASKAVWLQVLLASFQLLKVLPLHKSVCGHGIHLHMIVMVMMIILCEVGLIEWYSVSSCISRSSSAWYRLNVSDLLEWSLAYLFAAWTCSLSHTISALGAPFSPLEGFLKGLVSFISFPGFFPFWPPWFTLGVLCEVLLNGCFSPCLA